MKGEFRDNIQDIFVKGEDLDILMRLIDELESEAQGIRERLDEISGISDLHLVEDARDMAKTLADKLY